MAIKPIQNASSDELTKASSKHRYNINIAKYPMELASEEIKHYLEIQINVRGRSRFNKDNRLYQIDRPIDGANFSDDELAQASTGATILDGGMFGKKIAQGMSRLIPAAGAAGLSRNATRQIINFVGTLAGGLGGYTASKTNKLLKPDTKHRISDVINLYLAEPPVVKYTTQWANKDLGGLMGIISGSAFHNGMGNGTEAVFAAFTAQTAKLPQVFGGISARDVLSANTRTSLNPFKECIFESVDFRSFQFTYRFMPRSPEESQAVQDIIYLLKFHKHPEMDDSKLFFIYPSEFQLTYYFNGRENENLFRFAPCVLSEMEVSYGEGQFSSFRDGSPGEIIVKLTFRETEINTKESIEKGR